jgi:hypothetical protein
MKWITTLLLAAALSLGVICATTAYLPRLDLPDEQLIGLTLNADAGRLAGPDGTATPVARDDQPITAETLAALRAKGVERVRVKEFAFARWTHKGWFVLALAGLCGGAWLMRVSSRRAAATDESARTGKGLSPERAAERIHEIVMEVQQQLPTLPDDKARLRLILERLGEIQVELVPMVADARESLVARLGLSGYAVFMDQFAAAERQINRAWSAAADGVYAEAVECIHLSVELSRPKAAQSISPVLPT